MNNVEFDKTLHEYRVNNVKVPNVSEILGTTLFANKYINVPKRVMEEASHFGKKIHHAIETNEIYDLNELEFNKYDEYLGIKLKHNFEPYIQEKIVYYEHNGKIKYIGTFDMIAIKNDKYILIDIKTTYTLDFDYLIWQLSMYALAIEQQYNIKIEELWAIWLPKRMKGKMHRVDNEGILSISRNRKTKEEILKLVETYEQIRSE